MPAGFYDHDYSDQNISGISNTKHDLDIVFAQALLVLVEMSTHTAGL